MSQGDASSPRPDSPVSQPGDPETGEDQELATETTAADQDTAPQGKKQLSEKQKASLAKAREQARLKKLAKTAAKKEQEEAVHKRMAELEAKLAQKNKDEDMEDSDSSEPTPVKHKKSKKLKKKPKRAREQYDSSSESEPEPALSAQDRAKHELGLARAAYDVNMARYKNDVMYKSMFPYF